MASLLSSSSRFLITFPSISPLSINSNSDSISFSPNFSGNAKLLKKPQSISLSPNLSPEKYICKARGRGRGRNWGRGRDWGKRRGEEPEGEPEYIDFPDPIPEFADAEIEKFRAHLEMKLSNQEMIGDSLDEVIGTCVEIFSTFLHTEYGGPGTLMVEPFVDMADTIHEKGLPGGPQTARVAVKWAQEHVDKDWKEWTGSN